MSYITLAWASKLREICRDPLLSDADKLHKMKMYAFEEEQRINDHFSRIHTIEDEEEIDYREGE